MDRIFISLPLEEILTAVFWAITYLLICISGFLNIKIKKVSMPYVPGVVNYAWEINALVVSHGLWMYGIWFILDMIIVFWSIYFLNSSKKKLIYIIAVFLSTICFKILFSFEHGLIFTVFLIDLIMEISYLVRFKSLSPIFKKEIAIFKFLGDFFAGIAGIKYTSYAIPFTVIISILNGLYIWKCFTEKN